MLTRRVIKVYDSFISRKKLEGTQHEMKNEGKSSEEALQGEDKVKLPNEEKVGFKNRSCKTVKVINEVNLNFSYKDEARDLTEVV